MFRPQLIPEPNDVMRDSYLLLDEEMCFLNCAEGSKVPSQSILDVGVKEALRQAGFDHSAFTKRGGVYDWRRERKANPARDESVSQDPNVSVSSL